MTTPMNPFVWIEIPVKDMARAKAFYEHVLQLKLEDHDMDQMKMAWFPMIENGMGAIGSLVKGEGYTPSAEGSLVYLTTPDLDAALSRVPGKGGILLTEKIDIGQYGIIAHVLDTEGNRIGLHMPPKQ